jgi:hypothetical protein
VDSKIRWQALQARLAAARTCVAAGDLSLALEEINAALAIDPEFLAAHELHDRLVSGDFITFSQIPDANSCAASPADSPMDAVSAGYAGLEARARRRRIDRQLQVARVAIGRRGLNEAAVALDEVIELDPNVPELSALVSAFDDLRRSAAIPHRGPWFAAGAVFAVIVLGASWVDEQGGVLWSRPIVLTALVLPAPAASGVTTIIDSQLESPGAPDEAIREAITSEPAAGVRPSEPAAGIRPSAPSGPPTSLTNAPLRTEPAPAPGAPRPAGAVADLPLSAALTPALPLDLPAPADLTAFARPLNTTAPLTAESTGMVAKPKPDDELLVKHALQRYRVAYDGLDAQSAHAVWPTVNQTALARAFDGLASQRLTFDRCDVQLHSDTATATCHGTARYVPKIGSRDPRTEPRVWNFTLRRGGADWQIDSAQVGR